MLEAKSHLYALVRIEQFICNATITNIDYIAFLDDREGRGKRVPSVQPGMAAAAVWPSVCFFFGRVRRRILAPARAHTSGFVSARGWACTCVSVHVVCVQTS